MRTPAGVQVLEAPLTAREAYRMWAPRYAEETAVSFLENMTVEELDIDLRDRRLLDAGCGIARRLRNTAAAVAIGADVSPEMLREARDCSRLVAADVLALPFANGSFDVVWCRLVIGHVGNIAGAYAELGRVCAGGGTVLVTDFAPAAATAGQRRSFRDAQGVRHDVEHFIHSGSQHVSAAGRAGLELELERTSVVGPSIRSFYLEANRLGAYDAQSGKPLVSAFQFRKAAAA